METPPRKLISVTTNCYNEAGNLRELYERIRAVFDRLGRYDWELIIGDNHSNDGSRELLRCLAKEDPRVKVILNANNFGHIRSPMNVFRQARGDAAIIMCSDLQDPPEMIADFIRLWEEGHDVVCGVKPTSQENLFMYGIRKFYYRLLASFSDTEQIRNFTGYGLYDRKFLDAFRRFHDPYPYFRGLVGEIGFDRVEIPFEQQLRKHGKTKNNFFTLYDMAMTGFVNHTKMPLRLAVFTGFILALVSLMIALVYFIYKLVYWDTFNLGLAPLVIGLFFFSAIHLIFIGIIGEYLGAVWTQVRNRPLAVEEERINFDD
ncbi:MAG: glycosyltransferase family 2 protein [Lentisphaeria bacterium]|nr:glycosyltransferase family 2 protein [Lentisphaeria bacterium]